MDHLLRVEGVNVFYGKHQAVRDLSFTVAPGEVVAILGANGAGKTTLLRALSGLTRVASGQVYLQGQDVTNRTPDDLVKRGISHVPEGRRIFTRLTVKENLLVGGYAQPDRALAQALDLVLSFFPELKEKLPSRGGALSGGQQQMLAIGRALMSRPQLLMLDEPTMGLAPIVVDRLVSALAELNKQNGISILLVDQRLSAAELIAGTGYVMKMGSICAHLNMRELSRTDLESVYLA